MKKFFRFLSALTAAVITAAFMSAAVFADNFSDAKKSVVYIEAYFSDVEVLGDVYSLEGHRGSGFAIGTPGEAVKNIVTADHVIRWSGEINGVNVNVRASEVRVYFSYAANDFMRATINVDDEGRDIAVLDLPEPTDKREPLIICRDRDRDENDACAALGYPVFSEIITEDTAITLDLSDMSIKRGAVENKIKALNDEEFYLLDKIELSPGQSGGPLINENNEVIGINTLTVSGRNSNGLVEEKHYSICIDELLRIINRDEIPYTLSTEVSAPAAETTETEAADETTQAEETESSAQADETETEAATEQSTETEAPEAPAQTSETTQAAVPAAADSDNSGSNTLMIVIIAAAAVVVIVIVIAVVSKNKNSAPAQAPAMNAAPMQQGHGGAVITGMKGIMANRSFNINGSIVLGRNAQKCNVCFPVDSKGISGVHCQIRQVSGGYEIVDLGSSNGTFLGSGERLTPNAPVFIPDGTYFYLGSAEQLFQIKY